MTNHLCNQLEQIPVPSSLHSRCIMGMYNTEHNKKGQIAMLKFRNKAAAIAVVLTLTIATLGGSAAFADSIRGFFTDIKNPAGAITGTAYNSATEEIAVSAEYTQDAILVNAQFLFPNEAPFRFISELSLKNVSLTDSSGTKLMTVEETDKAPINNGSVSVEIPTGTLSLSPNEEYTLSFDTAVGHAKAEQPLPMSGNWSCPVTAS